MPGKYLVNTMPDQISDDIMNLFRDIETATIGHWRLFGFCNRAIRAMQTGMRSVGTAVTVAIPGADSTLLHHAIDQLRPGDFLVVDRLGDDRHACWGGGVSSAAMARGVAGAVVDGPVTDISEINKLKLPMWSRGLSPITTRIYDLGGRMNVPVSIGGVVVMPGDLVLADESGVLIIPASEAAEEGKKAFEFQKRGLETERRLKTGEINIGDLQNVNEMVLHGQKKVIGND